MPAINYEWLDRSRHLILAHYPKGYSWDDYHRNLDKLDEDLGEDEAPLYIINVYEKGSRLPPNIVSPHWKRSARTFNVNFVVYVTEDTGLIGMLKNFLGTINYKFQRNFDFAPTVDAAKAILEEKMATAEE